MISGRFNTGFSGICTFSARPVYRPFGFKGLITVTHRPHNPSIAAGLYCLTTSPDFSLLFARSDVGSFTCIGYYSPIHGTDGLKSPPKDWAMRIKRLAQGRYCRAGVRTGDLRYGNQRS